MSKVDDLLTRFTAEDDEKYSAGIRQMLETPEGRNVAFRLIHDSGLWDTSPYAEDAKLTAFQLGRQAMAREFLRKLNEVDPTAWPGIQLEAVAVAQEREQLLAATDEEDDDE